MGDSGKIREAAQHAVLRRYGAGGSLCGEFLPWPDFQCGLHPAARDHHLTALPGRVAVLFGECNRWLEFGLDGTLKADWTLPPPEGKSARHQPRVVAAPDGRVFSQFGEGLFELDRGERRWRPVAAGDEVSMLAGADGRALVLRTMTMPPNDDAWIEPRRETAAGPVQ